MQEYKHTIIKDYNGDQVKLNVTLNPENKTALIECDGDLKQFLNIMYDCEWALAQTVKIK